VRIRIERATAVLVFTLIGLSPLLCWAQGPAGAGSETLSAASYPDAPTPAPRPAPAKGRRTSSKLGIGVKASLLGVGLETAVPVASKLNLRGGFNAINYKRSFTKDGITYTGNLNWRSGETNLDWFPFGGGFHFSPGFIFYDGNKATANASVPGGQTFTLSGTTYMSSAADPVKGTGKLSFDKVAPTFRLGFGNLIPRSGRHWSLLLEVGAAYQGSPHAALNLSGTACSFIGTNCVNAATDPTVQASVAAEQTKLNHDLSLFKFYPLISLGFGFNF
jgi:hypothetical protein